MMSPQHAPLPEHWLLVDVGGTNTRVATSRADRLRLDTGCRLPNARFASLDALLRHALVELPHGGDRFDALCAGVAGPVRDGAAQLTNHDWRIDAQALADATGAARVTLINDLQAQGFALDDLPAATVRPLFAGAGAAADAPRLVIGLGTGCNAAVVHRTGRGLFVPPSESGHAHLPFAQGAVGAFFTELAHEDAHTPLENVLSGRGLQAIWRWLGGDTRGAAEIITAAGAGSPRAGEAVSLFSDILGRVARDMALVHLPMGGIYFCGGVARAIAPLLPGTGFHAAFCRHGPYSTLLREIPIHLVTDDNAALRGCARRLRQDAAG